MSPVQARPWQQLGFTPAEVQDIETVLRYWHGMAPTKNVSTPQAWVTSGFTRAEILAFIRAEILDVTEANRIEQAHPDHAHLMAALDTIAGLLA